MKFDPNVDLTSQFIAMESAVSTAQTYADLDMKSYEYGYAEIAYTKGSGTTLEAEIIVNGVSKYKVVADATSTSGVIKVDAKKNFESPTFTIKVTPSASTDYSLVLHKYNPMEVI
ncbi:MAG TPA: hypothetical protein ENG48_03275 [Candidatus Atribacteria bacterium]|nr:hypothetical protein [Candidatus Atribacteria bacterium]